jgi:hypothetical protein
VTESLTDHLRQIGQPDVDAWTDDDGEIDSLLVAKDQARADRELLAAARSHWDAICDVVDAAEALIADQDALYSVCPWCKAASPMHDVDCEYRVLRSSIDTVAQLGEGA